MKLEQYLIESARTVAPTTDTDLFVHAALGITTELEELGACLSVQNAIEEIGDVMWYVAILLRMQKVNSFEALKTNSSYTIAAQLTPFGAAAAIADAAKRHKFYGSEIPWGTVNFALQNIRSMLNTYCVQAQHPLEVALAANIEKLRARYPNLFEKEKAENRSLLDEEKALAKAIESGADITAPPAAPTKPPTTPPAPPAPPSTNVKLARVVGPGGTIIAGPAKIPQGPAGPTTRQH